MDPKNNKLAIYLPLAFSIALGLGILIGTGLNSNHNSSKNFFSLQPNSFNKINELINFIEQEYVDDIKKEQLVDKAINSILSDLDPHSYYIAEEELAAANEPLEGNFEGIGIEFNMQKDTLIVISTIEGGPSEAAGIIAGDRLIRVNGETIAGKKIDSEGIVKKLKGAKDTKVEVTVLRKNKKQNYTLVRGKIPIKSIDVGYMVTSNTGYIKLSRFAKNTHQEFVETASVLKSKGMTSLILDLRGNGGGYLDAAISLADEFLEPKKLIVYTEGKARPKSSHYSTNAGSFENLNLSILVDEGSASASEILAGAIQDHDKGLIIGRRTFGKGLVQEQVIWPDNSAIRLTIARYYTPSGRCIQKPYKTEGEDYFNETYQRYEKGELMEKDSIHFSDSLKFYTERGRIVYGGGGIMPDIFVPVDTTENNFFILELNQLGLINQFAFDYVDNHRDVLKKFKNFESFNTTFQITESIFNDFINYSKKNGLTSEFIDLNKSSRTLKTRLKAHIAKQLWKNEGFYKVIQSLDKTFQKALNTKTKI